MSSSNHKPSTWSNVADWSFLVLGVVLLVSSFTIGSMHMLSAAILGALMVAAALWDLAAPSIASIWAEGVVAFVVFLIPWFMPDPGYSGSGQWVTWIVGVIGIVCTAWSWASHTDVK
jgi:hypothetical protein